MKKKYLTSLMILAVAGALMGCPGKNKDKGVNDGRLNGRGGAGCSNCSESNFLYSALGRNGNGIEMVMDFFADDEAYIDSNNIVSSNNYSGAVLGEGLLVVAGGIGYSFCNLPVDTYVLNVERSGSIDSSETMTGVVVRGVGRRLGYTIQLSQVYSVFLGMQSRLACDGSNYNIEMLGQWRLEQVSNQSCNDTISFSDASSARQCL